MQAGMLRALYEQGIVPDLLVGTSAGALNAAFVASRPQTVETADQLARVWHELRREQIFPLSLRALVVGLAGHRDHLVTDGGLRRLVARHIEFADLGDAAVPLHIVAFDLTENCEVLLSGGSSLDVITAAASLPGIFPPVPIGGRSLVDGGVINNTPISPAVALGAKRIFVLPTREAAPSAQSHHSGRARRRGRGTELAHRRPPAVRPRALLERRRTGRPSCPEQLRRTADQLQSLAAPDRRNARRHP
jgi:NTE family protein